jgi:hypothetical protein
VRIRVKKSMSTEAESARMLALQAAQDYTRLARQLLPFDTPPEALMGQLGVALADVRDHAQVAFASCADSATWEALYAALGRALAEHDTFLAALSLPGPRDGSVPPTLANP